MTADSDETIRHLTELRERQDSARPPGVAAEVEYPLGEIAITEHLRHWARHAGQRTAIVFYGDEISYARLDELSDRFAHWLDSVGVHRGDRVGVHLTNCPQFVVAMMGILKLGAVHVPINPLFREHELRHELRDAGVEVVVTLDSLTPVVEAVRADTCLREVLVTSLEDALPREPTLPLPPLPDGRLQRSGWWQALDRPRWQHPVAELDALAALNYTGGTTGMPKGCEHTQRGMLYTAATMAAAQGVEHPSTSLTYVPIFWIAGEDGGVLVPIVTGGTCVLLNRWDPRAVLTALEHYRVGTLLGLVDDYLELLDQPDIGTTDLSALDAPLAMSVARKLTPGVRRRWQEVAGDHSVLREAAYGMTETHTGDTSPRGFQDEDRDLRSEPVFCGLPVPGTDIMVVSPETARPLPLGEHGEIVVRSPSLLRRYWADPAATAEALDNGWLRTGDVGVFDEQGCLHYLGRNKEMIKVNGMSVFPAEVETLLGRAEGVAAVGVVPREDPNTGQVPVAFVQPDPEATLEAELLRTWARENMAPYKVPVIRLVEELPTTATGKIAKAELFRWVNPEGQACPT